MGDHAGLPAPLSPDFFLRFLAARLAANSPLWASCHFLFRSRTARLYSRLAAYAAFLHRSQYPLVQLTLTGFRQLRQRSSRTRSA